MEEDGFTSAEEERVRIVILVRWALIATAVVSAATGVPTHALMEPSVRLASPAGAVAAWPLGSSATPSATGTTSGCSGSSGSYTARSCSTLVLQIPFLYYSGGIFSYGWMQYPVIVVVAALILPREIDTWLTAALGCVLALGFAVAEGAGWVSPAAQTTFSATVIRNVPSIVDRMFWTFGVMLLAAFLGTYLMGTVRNITQSGAGLKRQAVGREPQPLGQFLQLLSHLGLACSQPVGGRSKPVEVERLVLGHDLARNPVAIADYVGDVKWIDIKIAALGWTTRPDDRTFASTELDAAIAWACGGAD